jgi:O-antigen ligase
MSPTAVLALALVAAPVLAAAAVAGRRALVMALPFLAALNGLAVPLGPAAARPDQLAACLLAIPFAAALLSGARPARVDPTTRWLLAILAANVVASLLHSPARAFSLAQCASLASVWAIPALLDTFLDTRAEVDAFSRRALLAGAVACALGVGAFLLAAAGVPVGGAEVSRVAAERLTRAYGAYGTMVEPNIFGGFAGALLVVALALPRAAATRWAAAAAGAALVLSFTRAAWLGAAAGVVAFAALARPALGVAPSRRRTPALAPVAALVAAGVVLWLLPGSAGALFRFKLLNLVNLESQTATLRLLTYGLALDQTAAHPVIGSGTFTFAPLVAQGNDFRQFESWRNLWIGNWALLALHDTGVVGLGLWVGMLGATLRRGVRAARRARAADPALARRTLALTAAVASLLVPFLATTGFTLGYPWVLVGLLGAHCRLAERTAPSTDGADAADGAERSPVTPAEPGTSHARRPEGSRLPPG